MTQHQEARIAELEAALKEKERRLSEVKSDLDKANDLIERMRENVQDSSDLIDSWIEAYGLELRDNGTWSNAPWIADHERLREKHNELVRKWNSWLEDFKAVYRRKRNVGRPLLASDEQRKTVLKLRKRELSLRAIAEETSLGLNTVRTVIDQQDGRDRTSMKYLERIRRDMGEERIWQSRKRVRDGLPRRINAVQQQSVELLKEAKGLK